MLSRTADHLFWMSRYTERAENTARMLNVSYETSLLPQSADVAQEGWEGLLSISELIPAYTARHGKVTPGRVLEFMVRDGNNPSAILSCLRAARENARAVRGALTTEVWETQNQTWLELHRHLEGGAFERDPGQFFEWVKHRSHLSRGVVLGTMLQDEAFHFLRMGTFLERADNTARLLDVKFHAVKNVFFGRASERNQERDFYHWSAILRSVSAFEVYRKVYRDVITPGRVADLLILHPGLPRSLPSSPPHAAHPPACRDRGMPACARWSTTWPCWPTNNRRKPDAGQGACWPTCNMADSTKSWPPACTPSSRSFWTASTTLAAASAATFWWLRGTDSRIWRNGAITQWRNTPIGISARCPSRHARPAPSCGANTRPGDEHESTRNAACGSPAGARRARRHLPGQAHPLHLPRCRRRRQRHDCARVLAALGATAGAALRGR